MEDCDWFQFNSIHFIQQKYVNQFINIMELPNTFANSSNEGAVFTVDGLTEQWQHDN